MEVFYILVSLFCFNLLTYFYFDNIDKYNKKLVGNIILLLVKQSKLIDEQNKRIRQLENKN